MDGGDHDGAGDEGVDEGARHPFGRGAERPQDVEEVGARGEHRADQEAQGHAADAPMHAGQNAGYAAAAGEQGTGDLTARVPKAGQGCGVQLQAAVDQAQGRQDGHQRRGVRPGRAQHQAHDGVGFQTAADRHRHRQGRQQAQGGEVGGGALVPRLGLDNGGQGRGPRRGPQNIFRHLDDLVGGGVESERTGPDKQADQKIVQVAGNEGQKVGAQHRAGQAQDALDLLVVVMARGPEARHDQVAGEPHGRQRQLLRHKAEGVPAGKGGRQGCNAGGGRGDQLHLAERREPSGPLQAGAGHHRQGGQGQRRGQRQQQRRQLRLTCGQAQGDRQRADQQGARRADPGGEPERARLRALFDLGPDKAGDQARLGQDRDEDDDRHGHGHQAEGLRRDDAGEHRNKQNLDGDPAAAGQKKANRLPRHHTRLRPQSARKKERNVGHCDRGMDGGGPEIGRSRPS